MVYCMITSYQQGVFGTNIKEIVPHTTGTLRNYVATAVSFTLLSIWIIIAFQSKHLLGEDTTLWQRLAWPYMLCSMYFKSRKTPKEDHEDDDIVALISK